MALVEARRGSVQAVVVEYDGWQFKQAGVSHVQVKRSPQGERTVAGLQVHLLGRLHERALRHHTAALLQVARVLKDRLVGALTARRAYHVQG